MGKKRKRKREWKRREGKGRNKRKHQVATIADRHKEEKEDGINEENRGKEEETRRDEV